MTVRAAFTKDSVRDRLNCGVKCCWDLNQLASARVKNRKIWLRLLALFAQLDFEVSIYSAKQHLRFERRSSAALCLARPVLGNEQLASAPRSKHLNPHEDRRHHYRVKAVHSDCVNGMKIS